MKSRKKYLFIFMLFFICCCTTMWAQILQAEYFIDTDPGAGNATALSASDGSFNDALESAIKTSVNVSPVGMHSINIRVKDVHGNWGPVFTKIISIENILSTRNINIAQAELFWDTDPGQGSGTAMLAFDGNFSDALESVIKSGLSTPAVGTHKLCVRTQDAAGNWSPVFTTIVSVENILTTRNINIAQAELFWDTDPGQGSGAAMLAFDGNFNDALESAIKSSLATPAVGTHKLCVRVKDAAGNWGSIFTTIVSVENLLAVRSINILQAELFFDADPGQGNGTAMLAFDGNFNDALESVIKSGVTTPAVGTHKLTVRVKDIAGNWGPNFTTVLSVENILVPRDIKITQAELYWDTDPGQGNGTAMIALDGNFNDALESVINSGLTTPAVGTHKLCVRVKDPAGNWGPVFTKVVSIENQFVSRNIKITQAELFFDTDPGQGNGTAMLAFDGNFDDALESATQIVNTTFIAPGIHSLNVRVKDIIGNWGPLFTVAMYIDSCITTPSPTVTVNGSTTICQGDSVQLTANNGYNSYTWVTGITPIGTGNSIYIKTPGVYKVTVTDGNGCPGTSAPVIISTYSATINTSSSAVFCQGDSLLLSASAATSYTWSTGSNAQSIYIHATGSYTVTETNSSGCVASTIITATVNPVPSTPTITQNGSDLVSSASVGNQWYLNGVLIAGATASVYTPTQSGNYSVQVSNTFSCTSTSASLNFTYVGIQSFGIVETTSVYPNPFSETTTVNISGDISNVTLILCDAIGREMKRMNVENHSLEIDATELENGMYFIRLMKEKDLVHIYKIVVQK